jgi:dihydrofolate synthase/folylpolyglutamate synthase
MSAPDALGAASNLDWLFSLQRFGVKPGLGPIRALLTELGSPDERLRCVLVAGTNGKGSVARVLAASLMKAGERVGLYTSPHLQRLGERVQVDLAPEPHERIEELIGRVRPAAERHGNTFFEVVTAAALLRFAEAGVAWAVLEVGLGGRLDATNAVRPELSVITSVALDHTAVLGATLEEIAFEKAGVMRPGVPLISGVTEPRPAGVIARRAAEVGAGLTVYGKDFWGEDARLAWEGTSFTWRHPGAASDGVRVASGLVGRHQVANLTLALEAGCRLGVGLEEALDAVRHARWPGRLESFWLQGRRVVLDGAHNPAAARALAAAIAELTGEAAVLVFGASADKDVAGVVTALAPVARRTVVTHAVHSPRAMAPLDLAALLPGATVADDPGAALEAALGLSRPGETVVVAGSLFLVGEARDRLTGDAGEDRPRWQ